MNRNVKIAKELVKLAKNLLASDIPSTAEEMADIVEEKIEFDG